VALTAMKNRHVIVDDLFVLFVDAVFKLDHTLYLRRVNYLPYSIAAVYTPRAFAYIYGKSKHNEAGA
jgi:hypothetical protein